MTCSIMPASPRMSGSSWGGLEFERDGFAEQPLEHFGHVRDDLAQVEEGGLHDALCG